jgi:glycerol uptake facilitator-like aquaporin
MNIIRYIVELFGTFIYIYIILNIKYTSISFTKSCTLYIIIIMLILLTFIFVFGNIRYCYFNPAISFVDWINGTLDINQLSAYVAVQLLAAVAAVKFLQFNICY